MCLKLIFVISYHILGTSIVIMNADTNMTVTDVPTEPWDMYSNMSSSYASVNSTSNLGLVPEDPRGGEGVVNIFRIGYFYPLRWIESLFGWFGNCLVIVAVTRYPDLQTPTGSLLANLALADVLTASLTPLSTAVEAMGRSSQWLYCCIIKEILYTIASFGNILSLTLISIDRLMCITAPFWYNKHVTLGLTLVGQAIGWVVIFTIYIVIFTARSNINHPIPTCVYPFLISESDMKLFLLNPFYFLNSVTILNYVILVAVVWKQGRKIAPHVANATHQLQRRQRKLTMTTGIIVGGYLILTIPLTIMSFEVKEQKTTFTIHLQFLMLILWHLNSVINPIIYAYRMQKFRTAFRKLLGLKTNTVGPVANPGAVAGPVGPGIAIIQNNLDT